jgi:hypothetical protein
MCTVTYIPGKSGFNLTSNRDEHISRGKAVAPRQYKRGKSTLLYPKDSDKNGSWITAKSNGDLIVLLNGAFVKHQPQPKYKKSRGLILMDIINAENPIEFYRTMNLYGIEPFTIILYVSGQLYESRWDGGSKNMKPLDNEMNYIWSSVTLYDKTARGKREIWFTDFRNLETHKSAENIMDFHRHGGKGDLIDGLVIDRGGKMKTMSITNINVSSSNLIMTYEDLRENRQYVNELIIEKNAVKKENLALPHFFKLKVFLIRLFNWEYWSFNILYAPVMFYWFWLGLKSRSLFFFSTANPSITNGGFAMESKWQIYELMKKRNSPFTLFFKKGTALSDIKRTIENENLSYPMIAKPDIGGRGIQVKKVNNENELINYINQIRVDFLLQQYIPYQNEVGIFYHRIPGEKKGHISGIVGKEFLTVSGDGRSTIEALVIKNPRYLIQLPVLKTTHAEILKEVLPAGEKRVLVPYGNHSRGAKFIDLSHLITEELTQSIDAVCRQIPGFYFGRMDVMYNTWKELSEGENFSIVELNGAGSEPTHIYDSKHSLFFAWKEIVRHWELLYRISAINKRSKGLKYMTYREGVAMLKSNTEYLKLVS